MAKNNYYQKLKNKCEVLELIIKKHNINLDKEPLFLKYLSNNPKTPKKSITHLLYSKNPYIIEFN